MTSSPSVHSQDNSSVMMRTNGTGMFLQRFNHAKKIYLWKRLNIFRNLLYICMVSLLTLSNKFSSLYLLFIQQTVQVFYISLHDPGIWSTCHFWHFVFIFHFMILEYGQLVISDILFLLHKTSRLISTNLILFLLSNFTVYSTKF